MKRIEKISSIESPIEVEEYPHAIRIRGHHTSVDVLKKHFHEFAEIIAKWDRELSLESEQSTKLRPADELRRERDDRDTRDKDRDLAVAAKYIEDAHRAGHRQVTCLTFSDEVVEALKKANYRVEFNRACGMGDVDSHTIRWD